MTHLQTGATAEKYTVEATLGQGGMAVVYRVRHQQLGTLHALKILTLPSESIRERLLQEGRVQASLRHPNVVAVTDVIEVNGAPGLVMEYVKGPSLDQLLAKRRLSLDQISALAEGILHGVAAAHDLGVIHRDLKPANVMLAVTPNGLVPKVADFGLVKVLAGEEGGLHRTRSGMAMGTPAYMAPEQIRDAKNVDKRADVFSLGAILYELVTGTRAFFGDDMLEIFMKIAEGRYQPPSSFRPDLPRHMEQAIAGALRTDRDHRIPDCATLLGVWRGEIELDSLGEVAASGPWDTSFLAELESLGGGGEDSWRQAASPEPVDPVASGETFTADELALDIATPAETLDPDLATSNTLEPMTMGSSSSTSPTLHPSDSVAAKEHGHPPERTRIGLAALAGVGALAVLGLGLGWAYLPTTVEETGTAEVGQGSPSPPSPQEGQTAVAPEPHPAPAPTAAPTAPSTAPKPAPRPASPKPLPAPTRAPEPEPEPAPEPVPEPPTEPEPQPEPAAPAGLGGMSKVVVAGDVSRVYLLPTGGGTPLEPGVVPPGDYAIQVFFGDKPRKVKDITLAPDQTFTITCNKTMRFCQ